MKTSEIRKILRNTYGDRQYRITASGEIHVYGDMPHSIEDGWWLFGYVGEADTERRLEEIAE